jgi:hypothetical protein
LVLISGQFRATGTTTLATTGGNVGIGTTTPATLLQVVGTTTARTILPEADNFYTLGAPGFRWANIYAATGTFGSTIIIGSNTIQGSSTTTLFTTGNPNQLVLGLDGSINIGGNITGTGNLTITGTTILSTTTISYLNLNNPLSISSGGTGLTNLGSPNQILGVNAGGTGLEYKNITSLLTAGPGISITGTTNATIANTGILSLTAGPGISISSGQNPTITNLGVLSLNSATGTLTLQGTPNQVNVNTSGNTITLSTPQDIATTSNVQFNSLRLKDSLEIISYPTTSKITLNIETRANNLTTSGNQIWGIYAFTSNMDLNYSVDQLVGIQSYVRTYNKPINKMIAFQANADTWWGGDISNLVLYQAGPIYLYGGVHTNFYNFLVKNPSLSSGTLSNLYGLYVEPLTVGTNRWAIYVAGDNPSYFAGQIQAKAGTLTSPSYSFIGETNTGIFRPSAGTIAFITLGTERFRIDSSGNITGTGNLTITGTTTLATTTVSRLTISELQKGSILFAGDNGLISQDNSNLFWDNTNKRLGIGTSSPQYTLDLVGTLRAGNITLQEGSLIWELYF